jgi:hypothetical protein
MVNGFEKKRKNTTKTQLLPSFLTVDKRKKAIDFQNSPGTLYSRPLGAQSHNPNPYDTTVHLTSIYYWVPGNQEFCVAPSKAIVGQVKIIICLNCGIV